MYRPTLPVALVTKITLFVSSREFYVAVTHLRDARL
jgi:hypothetical protein